MSGTVNYVDYLFFPNRIQNRLSLFCISKLAVMLVVLARSLNFRCFIWTLEEKVFRSHGSVLMARLNLRCGVANSEPHKLGVVIIQSEALKLEVLSFVNKLVYNKTVPSPACRDAEVELRFRFAITMRPLCAGAYMKSEQLTMQMHGSLTN
jgi:hypothetical protein